MICYTQCPACGSHSISQFLKAKDHTVSNETFEIWECGNCSLRFTQNIPVAEQIGKYYAAESYVSHTDSRKGFINKIYPHIRNITLRTKLKLIQKITGKNNGKILDVGSGVGAFLNVMKTAGWQVVGLEPDAGARQKAKDLFQIDAKPSEEIYSLNEQFDAITLWHVLEHVHDLHGYLSRFQSLLKDDGRLVVAVPNYTSQDAIYYNNFWAAYDVPRHLYHFSPKSMELLLANHQFKLEEMQPMWFDSFYVSMLSEKYKNTGQQNLFGALQTGLWSNKKARADVRNCSSVIYVASKIN